MGQKVHPTAYRLALTHNWDSKWYAPKNKYRGLLAEDLRLRAYLKKKLANAAVSKITIERPKGSAKITIATAKPGIVIGKKGQGIDDLRKDVQSMTNTPVNLGIEEIRKPEIDAQLVAENIAQQLERRVLFRRAMKRSIANALRVGALGIKIACAGRLNGIEIARTEWYREGRVPLHTLRADIDYGFAEAKTTYGIIGIKVWIFKGETLSFEESKALAT
jgi:small subunit ribosomal protein S3